MIEVSPQNTVDAFIGWQGKSQQLAVLVWVQMLFRNVCLGVEAGWRCSEEVFQAVDPFCGSLMNGPYYCLLT
jgi:hypothetical protein